jgi:hypothetical protein
MTETKVGCMVDGVHILIECSCFKWGREGIVEERW